MGAGALTYPLKREVPEFYGKVSRNNALRLFARQYSNTRKFVDAAARSHFRIEVLRLVLFAVTSGGLWILLGASLPQTAAWFGALLTAVLSALSTFQLTLGPKRKLKEAYALLHDIGAELAALRGYARFDLVHFWERYEAFEFRLEKLKSPAASSAMIQR